MKNANAFGRSMIVEHQSIALYLGVKEQRTVIDDANAF